MISSLPLILDKLRDVMGEAPPEARRDLLAALILDLPAPARDVVPVTPRTDAELLTPLEAAAIAKISVRALLRLTVRQPFRHKLGHRTIRFEGQGLRRWVENRAGR